MKKIKLLLACMALVVSSSAFAANWIFVGEAYIELKNGQIVRDHLDELCFIAAKDRVATETLRIVDAYFHGFMDGPDGKASRYLTCKVKSEKYGKFDGILQWVPNFNGNYVAQSVATTANCDSGGLYVARPAGCWIVK